MPGSPLPPPHLFDIQCSLSYQIEDATDFLFQIHALNAMDQRVLSEALRLTPPVPVHVYADPFLGHRFVRLQAPPGELLLRYEARVQVEGRDWEDEAAETPISELPDNVLHNLMPTRYCESDLLGRAAWKLFGDLAPGTARVQAIADWIFDNLDYERGSTQSTTTASDVYLSRVGVCRDFAHLGVAFCRALNIPARLVAGYAIFDEPPPDFHAVFEAYLGRRWVLFDPTRLSRREDIVRIAHGRDAKDVAFATLFGPAKMLEMNPQLLRVPAAAAP
jgi:transglutaminase-like putative cysteine protease